MKSLLTETRLRRSMSEVKDEQDTTDIGCAGRGRQKKNLQAGLLDHRRHGYLDYFATRYSTDENGAAK